MMLDDLRLDQLTNRVRDRDMHFLDPRRRIRGDTQAEIAQPLHLSAAATRQPDDRDLLLARRVNGREDVHAVAAGRDAQ